MHPLLGVVQGGLLPGNLGRQLLARLKGAPQQALLALRHEVHALALVRLELGLQPLLLLLDLIEREAEGKGQEAGVSCGDGDHQRPASKDSRSTAHCAAAGGGRAGGRAAHLPMVTCSLCVSRSKAST